MKNLGLKLLLLCVMGIFTLGASATPDKDYLCFTANADGSTVKLNKNHYEGEFINNVIIQYSIDDCATWKTIDFSTETTTGTITLEKVDDKVYFRNANEEVSAFSYDEYNYYYFEMSGSIAASGNVMSLVDKGVETTTIPNDYCFSHLFKRCEVLTTAPTLPATTLKDYCYYDMFLWCTSLTEAPALPARTLAEGCYSELFYHCESLTKAPELRAEKMETYCYFRTFEGCINLTEAPVLSATTLASDCYSQMFFDCTGLKSAPALPATELEDWCYHEMFRGCTGLTSAPELPATELKEGCYCTMFFECSSLTEAPELPATTLKNWCYANMFWGCTSLTSAPELPATTLCNGCYEYMFSKCTNLKSIKVGFTEWYQKNVYDEDDDNATEDWLDNTASEGVFVCPDALDKTKRGTSNIPEGWKIAFEVKANQDPDNEQNYYSTFYSGTNAYEVPSGVTAYTGVAEGNVLKLTAIESGVIPAEEPVILKASQSQVYLPYTTETGNKSDGNKLSGTDEATTLGSNDYALSLGQNGVGFYLWDGKTIGANKAYLTIDEALGVKSLKFRFDDEPAPTGIKAPSTSPKGESPATYDLNGLRVNDGYKGIVIKNGKKVIR